MSYPAPILNLNFANAKQLVHPAVAFSRGSQGSYFDGSGIMRYANNSVPRFDHDPLTGICKGLLVEPAVTFLDTYSEKFDDAAWTKIRASITANAATAPDGALTADKLVEDTTAGNTHMVQRSFSVTSGKAYSLCVFGKLFTRSQIRLNGSDGTNVFTAYFDLSAVSVLYTSGTGATAKIVQLYDGWCLCVLTYTALASGTGVHDIRLSVSGSDSYTGDGTSGLYIWGAKLYAGTGPTSYLPTGASGVTRAADVCSVDLTKLTCNGSPLWTGTEGTIVVDAVAPAYVDAALLNLISLDIDVNNRAYIIRNWLGMVATYIISGGVQQAYVELGIAGNSTNVRIAFALKTGSFSWSFNGGVVVTSAGTMPVGINSLRIGCNVSNVNQWGGRIRSVQLYNRRIADSYLPALSAL